MRTVLKVSGLSVLFAGEPAVQDVNFEINEGDCLAIIGPNGAGKTALLRALLGQVPYEGEIAWGAAVRQKGSGVRLGYVPQKIDADKHLPVSFRNLLTAKAAVLGVSKNEIENVADAVGLNQKILETPVGHLSGGQFQRALIGFALLGDPKVLLFDEPTASIDVTGEQQMYELIHRLQDERGITVILVSHDLSFVYRYATKVLCLNQSGNICFGPPEEALTPAVLEQLYGPHKHFHQFHQPDEGK